jgi:hypothetical protein
MVPFGLVLLAALPRASGQCTGVTAPANGALGDCPPDGTLADGGWCLLTCNSGFRLTGGQPSCARSASGQCPLAEDSGTFTDAKGEPCTGWAQANRPGQTCAEAGAGWAYSAADIELVTFFCPVTCEAVPAACFDHVLYPACADDLGYSAVHPTLGALACADWARYDCTTSGFEPADQAELIAKCPASCHACVPRSFAVQGIRPPEARRDARTPTAPRHYAMRANFQCKFSVSLGSYWMTDSQGPTVIASLTLRDRLQLTMQTGWTRKTTGAQAGVLRSVMTTRK